MIAPTESGMVEIVGGVLTYRSACYGVWSLPMTAIQKIEEYTNSDGPLLDATFYRFSTATREERIASSCAVGWEEAWPALEQAFPGLESPGLGNSMENNVRLLWPVKKKGSAR
jgi:hypothetical protein